MDDDRGSSPPPRVIGKGLKRDQVTELPVQEKPVLAPPKRPSVVNAEEFEARTTAQQIIADAQRKGEELLEEAKKRRDQFVADAQAEARAEVMAKATEELARAKMQAGQIIAATEKDILDLALKIAAKIIGRDLERDSETVLEICATAIEHARAAKALVLRVNPKDSATLREKRPKLMELIGRTLEIAIRDDADVEEGGCIIQTEFGRIDAQLSTQYEMLRNVLYPDTAKKEGPK